MTNEVSQNYRRYYLSEFELYDNNHFITFNIVDINTDKNKITVAITNEGKISVCTYDLCRDGERFFFEYGLYGKQISVEDFDLQED